MTSRVDTTPDDVELQPYSLTADWMGLGHKGNATMGGYSPVPVSEILTNRGREPISPAGHSPARWCDNHLLITLSYRWSHHAIEVALFAPKSPWPNELLM